MEHFTLAIQVVFPLFFMMSLGYYLKVVKIFQEEFLKQLNNLCFKVFLPIVLFSNIYHSDFHSLFQLDLILFAVVAVNLSFFLLFLLIPLIEKENVNRAVVIQGIFRSNFILFGIPVTASLYGGENTGVSSILIAFVVPFYNLLATVALSYYSSQKKSKKDILRSILRNPLILASFLGMFFALTQLKLPVMLSEALYSVGSIASPLSLIVLGGGFAFGELGKYPKQLSFSIVGKLLLMPALFLPLAIWYGFREMELTALLAMLASPTAVSSYTMAQNMKVNDVLAGQIVVLGSLLSVLSMCFWITLLKQHQLI